ncbi:MAG: hypothetical protein M1819_000759 [Sarea resinae]|nr:MAG: hypothetical protein M1819_000759 [Sarea resinae]
MLAQSAIQSSDMVSKTFDGSQGPMEEAGMHAVRRQLSNSGTGLLRDTSEDAILSPVNSGLDQRNVQRLSTGEASSIVAWSPAKLTPLVVSPVHEEPKQLEGPDCPGDEQQTVSQAALPPINEDLGPASHNIPSDYVSEPEMGSEGEDTTPNPITNAQNQPDTQTTTQFPLAATAPVDEVKSFLLSEPAIRAIGSMPSLRSKSPRPSVHPTASLKSHRYHYHMLLKPSGMSLDMGLPVPPALTMGIESFNDDGSLPSVVEVLHGRNKEYFSHDPMHLTMGNSGATSKLSSQLNNGEKEIGPIATAKEASSQPNQASDTSSSNYSVERRSDKVSTPHSNKVNQPLHDVPSYGSSVREARGLSIKRVSADRVSAARSHSSKSLRPSFSSQVPSRTSSGTLPASHGEAAPKQDGSQRTGWMRKLLKREPGKTSSGRYVSHLTARPYRRSRSGLTTGKNAATNDGSVNIDPPIFQAKTVERNEQDLASESFTKVILDLEDLLQEALFIAKQAAEREDTGDLSAVLEEAALVLRGNNASAVDISKADGKLLPASLCASEPGAAGNEQDKKADPSTESPVTSSDSSTSSGRASSLSSKGLHVGYSPINHVPVVEPSNKFEDEGQDSIAHDKTAYTPASAMTSGNVSDAPIRLEASPRQPPSPEETGRDNNSLKQSEISNIPTPDRFYRSYDWAYPLGGEVASAASSSTDTSSSTIDLSGIRLRHLHLPAEPIPAKTPDIEQVTIISRGSRHPPTLPSKEVVREHIGIFREPPINPRSSSSNLGRTVSLASAPAAIDSRNREKAVIHGNDPAPSGAENPRPGLSTINSGIATQGQPLESTGNLHSSRRHHHFSIRDPHGFSLSRSHRRQPIARDWDKTRKRTVAAVACISTALIGFLIGVYVRNYLSEA